MVRSSATPMLIDYPSDDMKKKGEKSSAKIKDLEALLEILEDKAKEQKRQKKQ